MDYPKDFDRDLTYYLAGPMSGIPDFNYPAFETTQLNLVVDRVKVASPHNLPWPEIKMSDEDLWKHMMAGALNMLLGCNGIILLAGFMQSKGAMQEFMLASSLKYPAYFVYEGALIPLGKIKETL